MSAADRIYDQGQFRGVPFYYKKVDGEVGRKTILREYPTAPGQKPRKPRVEDLGLATRRFTIEMFFIGTDYDVDRDEMREALETEGPGELTHPYWGVMQVTIDGKAHFSEDGDELGMARCTVSFIETGTDDIRTLERFDSKDGVDTSAQTMLDRANAAFDEAYSVAGTISAVINEATQAVQDVAGALDSVRGKVASALRVIDKAKDAIDNVFESAEDLIRSPQALAESFQGVIDSISDGITNLGEAFDDVADFFDGEEELPSEGSVLANKTRVDVCRSTVKSLRALPEVVDTVPDGETQQLEIRRENRASFVRMIKSSAIASISQAAVKLTYESYDQAQEMREALTDFIDELLADDITDEVYGPLADLRANLCDHFAAVANSLPEMQDYTPQRTLPALVISYQIYATSTRETEILARNLSIRDPSAVPGGATLQVLVDV